MQIRWNNIFGLLALMFLFYIFVKAQPVVKEFFEELKYNSFMSNDPVWQFFTLSLFCLSAIAIFVIIFRR